MYIGAISPNTSSYVSKAKEEPPAIQRKESEERVESARKRVVESAREAPKPDQVEKKRSYVEKSPDREKRKHEPRRESSYDRGRSHYSSRDDHRYHERSRSSHHGDKKSHSSRDDQYDRYEKKRGRSPDDDDKYDNKSGSSMHSSSNSSSSKAPRIKEPERPAKQTTHTLPMSGVIYLDNIKKGIKTHEGRICRGTVQSMRIGDGLILRDSRANRAIECQITSCTRYNSFREMLVANGVLNMLPQLAGFARTANPDKLLEEGIKVYEKFPGSQDVGRLGVVAIGVNFIKDC